MPAVASFLILPGTPGSVDEDVQEGISASTATSFDGSTDTTVFAGPLNSFNPIEHTILEIGSEADYPNGGQDSSTTFINNVQALEFFGNEGDNEVDFRNNLEDSTLEFGEGDDLAVLYDDVEYTSFEFGDGADKAYFFDDIEWVQIDLGGDDGDLDSIFISEEDSIESLTFSGGDDGDTLIVGGEDYTWSEVAGGFVDDDDDLYTAGGEIGYV